MEQDREESIQEEKPDSEQEAQSQVVAPEGGNTKAIVEALVIATTEPLPVRGIAQIANVPEGIVRTIIEELNEEYRASSRAFEIKEIAGGFQIYTLPRFAQWVGALHKKKEKLSKAALETLAIVAYHQPIIRADIEKIRGVDTTSVLDTLLMKNLIKTCGRLPSPGRPIKYGTTKEFLRYFGIKDIGELPKEEDFGDHVSGSFPASEIAQAEGQERESGLRHGDIMTEEGDSSAGTVTEQAGDEIIDLGVDDETESEETDTFEHDDKLTERIPDSVEDSDLSEDTEESEERNVGS